MQCADSDGDVRCFGDQQAAAGGRGSAVGVIQEINSLALNPQI